MYNSSDNYNSIFSQLKSEYLNATFRMTCQAASNTKEMLSLKDWRDLDNTIMGLYAIL